MRIDGTHGLEPQGLPEGNPSLPKTPHPGDVDQAQSSAEDIIVSRSHEPYIRQAMAAEEVNTQAVAEARKLLRSGQLDTPEAARRAAQAILRLGI